jgi:hypothetical protein
MPNCPVCSSDEVYDLLHTLHCKRCKNIWKEGDSPDPSAACGSPESDNLLRVRKRTDPLETRLEKKLTTCLTRSGGKFSFATMTWQAGDISPELFRRYVQRCVNNRTLAETKDRYGRTWYLRQN